MILVTGATGFLGSEVCSQLAMIGPVKAAKRPGSKIPARLAGNPNINWVTAALEDMESMEVALDGVSVVFHCAALVSFNPADRDRLFEVNINGTARLVDLCLEHNIKLIHVSSVAALGDARKGEKITENDYPDPGAATHAYGISKYEGEMEVWRGIAEGLNAVIVNPSVIIGANAGFGGSGAIFKLVKGGLKFYTSGASGFVDVADVAACMLMLNDAEISGERYIISSENYHYEQLFKEIADGFKVKAPSIMAKPWMLGMAWRLAKLGSFFTRQPAGLTRDSAKSSLNVSYYSNDKITKTIGFKFKPVAISISEITTALNGNTHG